jgi:hypothetical protein
MKYKYTPDPNMARNIGLRILRHAVDDDRFLRIFSSTSTIIRASVKSCASAHDDVFVDDEGYYIEELLGLSFVLLQAKISRVEEAATKWPLALEDVRDLGGPYKGTGKSLVSLIWAIANYYKHNDTWGSEEWSDEVLDPKMFSKEVRSKIELARKTRRIVGEKKGLGFVRGLSAGNMRTAYEFFAVDWTSDCTPLADKVQEWAKAVYEKCANP